MTQAVSEWLALDVKDIDEKKLLPDVIGKDGVQPHLPTQMVKIPFDNPDQVAVVSWRWDGDLQTKGSRNIVSVVRVAKQRDIRYLFIDIISIDQKLSPSDLIAQVAAFSALYTKTTVLAAYDLEEQKVSGMMYTVFRPWILNEMRLFRQNPGRIIYAGHCDQGLIPTLNYSRYSFRMVPDEAGVSDESKTISKYEIALDGTPVAQWTDRSHEDKRFRICTFHPTQGNERTIFKALGLADSDYKDYVATEEARLACLQVDNRKEIPGPFVEVIEVDLLSE
ncbi:unnamed protein product [Alternaria alternata]